MALVWDVVLPMQTIDEALLFKFYAGQAERFNPEKRCAAPTATPGPIPTARPTGTAAPSTAPSGSAAPSAQRGTGRNERPDGNERAGRPDRAAGQLIGS